MQVSFRKVVLGSLAAMALAVPSFAEIKVGVIDYGRLLNESPQAKALTEALDAEFNPRYQQLVTQDKARALFRKVVDECPAAFEYARDAARWVRDNP